MGERPEAGRDCHEAGGRARVDRPVNKREVFLHPLALRHCGAGVSVLVRVGSKAAGLERLAVVSVRDAECRAGGSVGDIEAEVAKRPDPPVVDVDAEAIDIGRGARLLVGVAGLLRRASGEGAAVPVTRVDAAP